MNKLHKMELERIYLKSKLQYSLKTTTLSTPISTLLIGYQLQSNHKNLDNQQSSNSTTASGKNLTKFKPSSGVMMQCVYNIQTQDWQYTHRVLIVTPNQRLLAYLPKGYNKLPLKCSSMSSKLTKILSVSWEKLTTKL